MPEPTPATEKVIFEFQHTDEQGQAILDPRTGKPAFTNLTGKDWEEVANKIKDSYLNVNRALARARNYKPVPKDTPAPRKELSAEEQRQAVIDMQDPVKAPQAIRKLSGIDDIEAEREAAKKATYAAECQKAVYQFLTNHSNDYFPCQANKAAMGRYIEENGLDPRVPDNYEIAFNAVHHLLAQKPQPAIVVPPPEPEAPPAPRRASSSIEPSGARPPNRQRKTAEQMTREEINKLRQTEEGRAEYRRRMKDPNFVAQVEAAFRAAP